MAVTSGGAFYSDVDNAITGAIADLFDALVATLFDARLELDIDGLLWSTVNLFRRRVDRLAPELDGNEQAQRTANANRTARR